MMNRLLIIMVVLSVIDTAFSYLGNAHRSMSHTVLRAEKEVPHNCDYWHGNKHQSYSYLANGNSSVFRYQCRISIMEIQSRSILDSL